MKGKGEKDYVNKGLNYEMVLNPTQTQITTTTRGIIPINFQFSVEGNHKENKKLKRQNKTFRFLIFVYMFLLIVEILLNLDKLHVPSS